MVFRRPCGVPEDHGLSFGIQAARAQAAMMYRNQPRHRHRVRAAHAETAALDCLQ